MFKKALVVAGAVLALAVVIPNVVGVASAAPAPADCTSGDGQNPANKSIAALTASNKVLCFRRAQSPLGAGNTITGYTGTDTKLVGIDYRTADGLLYGVGDNGGIYSLDPTTGVLTSVGDMGDILTGTAWGVDFNPAADRLRIVSDDGQNLRIQILPMAGGVVVTTDTVLNNGAVPPVTVTGILGAAYTNNDADALTNTTLFDLNAATNAVMIQSPANNGVVVNTGTSTIDVTDGDLDIYTGSDGFNAAFALFVSAGGSRLHYIDLLTGRVGGAGRAVADVVDIALPINQ